jgi:hypothetical protein
MIAPCIDPQHGKSQHFFAKSGTEICRVVAWQSAGGVICKTAGTGRPRENSLP